MVTPDGKMNISDLQVRQGNVEVQGKVTEKGDVREWSKFGKAGKVCSAVLADGSGSIKLSLWNEQADEVKLGDIVKISNGFVNEYRGEKQLTTGRMGKIEVVGSNEAEQGEIFSNIPPGMDPDNKQQGMPPTGMPKGSAPDLPNEPVTEEEYIG